MSELKLVAKEPNWFVKTENWITDLFYFASSGAITANGITYIRTILSLVGLILLILEYPISCIVITIIWMYLDRIDGLYARRYEEKDTSQMSETEFLHYKEKRINGAYIDRTADKVTVLIYLIYFLKIKVITFKLLSLSLFVLCFVELFSLIISIRHWIKDLGDIKNARDNKAKKPGKIKMFLECVVIYCATLLALISLYFQEWWSEHLYLEQVMFLLTFNAVCFAVTSVHGHIKTMKT